MKVYICWEYLNPDSEVLKIFDSEEKADAYNEERIRKFPHVGHCVEEWAVE